VKLPLRVSLAVLVILVEPGIKRLRTAICWENDLKIRGGLGLLRSIVVDKVEYESKKH
jgi:hypothetical protein